MKILCCREANTDHCNVELGRIYAGNYSSIEVFLDDMKEQNALIEESGMLYHDDETEEAVTHWKLSGHEVHKSTQSGRFDAVVILYYSPDNPLASSPLA
jgi:hypothetical protein